jgi:hypothetical protein
MGIYYENRIRQKTALDGEFVNVLAYLPESLSSSEISSEQTTAVK